MNKQVKCAGIGVIEPLEGRMLLSATVFSTSGHALNPDTQAVLSNRASDSAGDVYVTGSVNGPVMFGAGKHAVVVGHNVTMGSVPPYSYLAKYSPTGSLLWIRSFQYGWDRSFPLYVDAAGNAYVSGINGNLTKFGRNGRILWQFGLPANTSLAAVNAAGDAYLTGSYYGTVNFGTTAHPIILNGPTARTVSGGREVMVDQSADAVVVKYNSSGQAQWAIDVAAQNPSGAIEHNAGSGVTVGADGSVYVAGTYQGTANFDPAGASDLTASGSSSFFAAKYDQSGDFEWAQSNDQFTGTASPTIYLDSSGNAYVAENNGFWELDSSGDTVWFKTFSGLAGAVSAGGDLYIEQTVTGTESTAHGTINGNRGSMLIEEYDNSGQFLGLAQFGPLSESDFDVFDGLTIGNNGDVVASGEFTGVASFDPFGTAPKARAVGYDMFLMELQF